LREAPGHAAEESLFDVTPPQPSHRFCLPGNANLPIGAFAVAFVEALLAAPATAIFTWWIAAGICNRAMRWLPSFSAEELVRILDLGTTFFLDAAVLIFIFPILDTFVQYGRERLTWRLFFATFAISGIFFVMAVVTTVLAARRKAE
jgi:hypothetical protein